MVKALRPDQLDDEDERRWLRLKGRVLAAVDHPNVARAYEVLEQPRTMLLFESDRCDTLARALECRGSGFTARQVVMGGCQVAAAIRHLHARGLLHLGVRPSTVLVGPDQFRLFDLGSPVTGHSAATGGRPLLERGGRGPLTDREQEVLTLVGAGLPNKRIAWRSRSPEKTVKAHLTHIYQRIGVTDRTQAALWARDRGLHRTPG